MSDETKSSREQLTGRLPAQTALRQYRVPLGLLAIVLFLRPFVAQEWMLGFGQIASTMLIWMVFVASFNLLFGYTGLLSFGHALFFDLGVYSIAIGLSRFDLPFVVSGMIGVLVAAIVGYLIVQKGEIYFAMLTLAFGQAAWFIFDKNPYGLTGGSTGISQGVLSTWIDSYRGQLRVLLGGFTIDWYWLVAAMFLVMMLLLWQIVRSPFGRSLIAIRENEELARAMGIDTTRYKVWSFTFAAAIAAVAGTFLTINNHGATTQVLQVVTSGDAILMAVLGGTAYYFGPLAGVFLWMTAESFLTDFEILMLPLAEFPLITIHLGGILEYWPFFLGLLFVIVVLISPQEGLWGGLLKLTKRLRKVGSDQEVSE